MKLIDSIIRGQFDMSPRQQDRATKATMIECAKSSVCTDIQNVKEWFDGKFEHKELLFKEAAPLAKMPFPMMWFEYKDQLTVQHHDNPRLEEVHLGFLAIEGSEKDLENTRLIEGWIFSKHASATRSNTSYNFAIELNEDFSINTVKIFYPKEIDEDPMVQDYLRTIRHSVITMGSALSFFNCKNVLIRHVKPHHKEAKAYYKKHGIPLSEMQFIEIHKNMNRIVSHSTGESIGTYKAHIVRGHFKRYEGEKKLFGKRQGVWFWQSHVRGKGTPTKKDYRVWGPNQDHDPKCIVQP